MCIYLFIVFPGGHSTRVFVCLQCPNVQVRAWHTPGANKHLLKNSQIGISLNYSIIMICMKTTPYQIVGPLQKCLEMSTLIHFLR